MVETLKSTFYIFGCLRFTNDISGFRFLETPGSPAVPPVPAISPEPTAFVGAAAMPSSFMQEPGEKAFLPGTGL